MSGMFFFSFSFFSPADGVFGDAFEPSISTFGFGNPPVGAAVFLLLLLFLSRAQSKDLRRGFQGVISR